MNVEIRALDSFVHGTLNMNKRETRAVPEAVAASLIAAGLAETVAKQRPQRTPAAATAKNAPQAANKMAQAPANKAATVPAGAQSQLPVIGADAGGDSAASVVVRDTLKPAT